MTVGEFTSMCVVVEQYILIKAGIRIKIELPLGADSWDCFNNAYLKAKEYFMNNIKKEENDQKGI